MNQDLLATLQAQIDQSFATPSPLGGWFNPTLRAAERGHLVLEFVVRPEMLNPAHILHGGMVASMLDECMGATVFSLGKADFYASVNLHIDYLATAREADILLASASVIREGQQLLNLEATLHHAERLIARASSNFIRVKKLTPQA